MDADVRDETYNLTLKGNGVEISKEIGPTAAAAIIQLVMTNGANIFASVASPGPTASSAGQSTAAIDGRRVSLREWVVECEAKSYPEKVVAVGLYMRDHEGAADFGRDDIRDRFRGAGEPPAANLPRDVSMAVKSGWIAEDHQNRGRFYVTRTGEEAVARHFAAGVSLPRPKRRSQPAQS